MPNPLPPKTEHSPWTGEDHYGHDPILCKTCVNRSQVWEEMIKQLKLYRQTMSINHDGEDRYTYVVNLIKRAEAL